MLFITIKNTKYTMELKLSGTSIILRLYGGWLNYFHDSSPMATATIQNQSGYASAPGPVASVFQQELTPLQHLHAMSYKAASNFP